MKWGNINVILHKGNWGRNVTERIIKYQLIWCDQFFDEQGFILHHNSSSIALYRLRAELSLNTIVGEMIHISADYTVSCIVSQKIKNTESMTLCEKHD